MSKKAISILLSLILTFSAAGTLAVCLTDNNVVKGESISTNTETKQENISIDEYNTLLQEVDSLNNLISQYEKSISDNKEKIQKLNDEITTLQSLIDDYKTQIGDKENSIVELTEENSELQTRVSELEASGEADAEEIANLNAQIEQNTATILSLQNEVSELQSELETSQGLYNGLSGQYEALQNENMNLNNQISELNSALIQRDELIAQYESQLAQTTKYDFMNDYVTNVLVSNSSNYSTGIADCFNGSSTFLQSGLSNKYTSFYPTASDQCKTFETGYGVDAKVMTIDLDTFIITELDQYGFGYGWDYNYLFNLAQLNEIPDVIRFVGTMESGIMNIDCLMFSSLTKNIILDFSDCKFTGGFYLNNIDLVNSELIHIILPKCTLIDYANMTSSQTYQFTRLMGESKSYKVRFYFDEEYKNIEYWATYDNSKFEGYDKVNFYNLNIV